MHGRDELGETRSELAVELEAGYLTAAMQDPGRASEAHREADCIVRAARPTNRAERELASKAMNMRLWAAAPRDELLAIARRLFGDGELARQDGAESRAYRARGRVPQPVRRLRGRGDGDRADVRRRAAARLGVDVRGGLAAARAAAALDGSDRRCRARRARRVRHAARRVADVPARGRLLPRQRPARAGRARRPPRTSCEPATGRRRPWASSPPGSSMRPGDSRPTVASTSRR